MIATDASAWISYLVADDVHHAASSAWFERVAAADESLVAPRLLLLEVVTAIARRTGDATIRLRVAERLRQHPRLALVSMTDSLVDDSAHVGAQLRLRAADAVYIATAIARGARLVTWDREQLARGAALVATTAPADDLMGRSAES